jgi:hypothetical protein
LYCDLHTHTTASDGDLTPLQLVNLAQQNGLAALGVTDHDTVAGLPEAVQAAKRCGLPLAWGVELSADFEHGSLHILGYFIDISNELLLSTCRRMSTSRESRNAAILDRLTELGMPATLSELLKYTGDDTAGRPHIADLMVSKGYVADRREAFERYLAKGAEAYVDRERLSPVEAIEVISKAGGVAVLAHPFYTGLAGEKLSGFVGELKEMGLRGIESHYYDHTSDEREWLEKLAAELELIQSGGSDFHGPERNKNDLGLEQADFKVPFQFYDELRKAANKWI